MKFTMDTGPQFCRGSLINIEIKFATTTTLLYLSPDLKIAPAFNRVTRQVQLIEKRAKLGPFFPSYGRGDISQI
jgi:hypothetical protein